jgi:hypothetical protein
VGGRETQKARKRRPSSSSGVQNKNRGAAGFEPICVPSVAELDHDDAFRRTHWLGEAAPGIAERHQA